MWCTVGNNDKKNGCKDILRTIRSLKESLSNEKRQNLQALYRNKDIIIQPIDKANARVMLSFEDYDNKMKAYLREPVRTNTTDLTTYLEKTMKIKIKECPMEKETNN